MNTSQISYDLVSSLLPSGIEELPVYGHQKPAAVAMVLRESTIGLDMLFIERARHPNDPWSGNIGFPGGRRDPSDTNLRCTAERETMEEVGIDLGSARYLGQLSDIVGQNLPVRVSCFVYGVCGPVRTMLSDEVSDAFWFSLTELTAHHRQVTSNVRFGDRVMDAPAIDLGLPGKPVLWGITYRFVGQFRQIIESGERGDIPYELEL